MEKVSNFFFKPVICTRDCADAIRLPTKKKGDWYPQTLNSSNMKEHEAYYKEELGSEG
jgi:hypothetical protein